MELLSEQESVMAFWRLKSMDITNPFTRQFWTKENLFGVTMRERLEEQMKYEWQLTDFKKKLHSECEIPEDFFCPITLDIFDHPVVTRYGHLFSKYQLTHSLALHGYCPLTRKPLTKNDLIEDSNLNHLINEVKLQHQKINTTINELKKMDDAVVLQKDIQIYHAVIEVKTKQLHEIVNALVADDIKNRLKIDKNKEEHLQYWSEQNRSCFHGRGGVEIRHPGSHSLFRVPTRVYHMIQAASEQHSSQHKLVDAIDYARVRKSPLYNNPFSFLTRKPITASVYGAESIEEIDLREEEKRPTVS